MHLPTIVKLYGPIRTVSCEPLERVMRTWLNLHRRSTQRINVPKTLCTKVRWVMHARSSSLVNPSRVEFPLGVDAMNIEFVTDIFIAGVWYRPGMILVHSKAANDDPNNVAFMCFKYATVDKNNVVDKTAIVMHGRRVHSVFDEKFHAYKVELRDKSASVNYYNMPSPFPLYRCQRFDTADKNEYYVHIKHALISTVIYDDDGQPKSSNFQRL